MNGLSELSGAMPRLLPFQNSEQGTHSAFAFPGNLASVVSGELIPYLGGSESASHQESFLAVRPCRKPPRREGCATELLASSSLLWEASNRQMEAEIRELKTKYVFRNESAIIQFILGHRASPAVLLNALPELKRSFGEDVVFNLEAMNEDDESTSLYAVVVWRGLATGAEVALEDFDERWWLNQSAQPGLTFTYELA